MEDEGIRDLLEDPAPWDEIVKVRKLWFGTGRDPLAKTLRNALAFHPGDLEAMRKTIRRWPKTRVAVLVVAKGDKERDTSWPFGLELVLRSEGITLKKLEKFIRTAQIHQFEMQPLLGALLLALAKSNEGKKRRRR
ncbi:MAG: hypothetical protein ACLQVI_22020 [Polyangiaceae bacterium]